MYDVANNLHKVLGTLPDGVKLVAISKFHPNEYIGLHIKRGNVSLVRVKYKNSHIRLILSPKISNGTLLVIFKPIK